MILNLNYENGAVSLGYTICVDSDLQLTLSVRDTNIEELSELGVNFPKKVNHLNQISEVCDHVENLINLENNR